MRQFINANRKKKKTNDILIKEKNKKKKKQMLNVQKISLNSRLITF